VMLALMCKMTWCSQWKQIICLGPSSQAGWFTTVLCHGGFFEENRPKNQVPAPAHLKDAKASAAQAVSWRPRAPEQKTVGQLTDFGYALELAVLS
jgi:hypothetical protein